MSMTPDPESVMEEVENSYDYTCELVLDDTIETVDVDVDFVVEDVPPEVARDLAKFVSVRGYQAYLGAVKDSQTGNIPVSREGESK